VKVEVLSAGELGVRSSDVDVYGFSCTSVSCSCVAIEPQHPVVILRMREAHFCFVFRSLSLAFEWNFFRVCVLRSLGDVVANGIDVLAEVGGEAEVIFSSGTMTGAWRAELATAWMCIQSGLSYKGILCCTPMYS
jgi:hypothetical protein